MTEVIDGVVVTEDEVPSQDLLPTSSGTSVARRDEWTIDELLGQVEKVKAAMQRAMDVDVHYGVIPGTGKKPTLLKPGAERLNSLFRLAPSYPPERMRLDWHDDGHFTATVVCVETHIPTGLAWSEGLGLCSSREKKYAERTAELVCPTCSRPTLRKSKRDPEFYCWAKIGGCGATFPLSEKSITKQDLGKVANPDLPDTYNTVLKMAAKRALIAAVLNATAASDLFTQDVEDKPQVSTPAAPAATPPPRPAADAAGMATRAQHRKHNAALGELQTNHERPDGVTWQDVAKAYVAEHYGVQSRSLLSKEQMSELIGVTEGWLAAQDVPFGDPAGEQTDVGEAA